MREAMSEVFIPTQDKPATLQKLSRDSVRETLRILTGGRTVRPLVASLEKSGELPEALGNFLLCDPTGNWRKEMVKLTDFALFVF